MTEKDKIKTTVTIASGAMYALWATCPVCAIQVCAGRETTPAAAAAIGEDEERLRRCLEAYRHEHKIGREEKRK